jgi:trehalose 6-phosphate phosphatase
MTQYCLSALSCLDPVLRQSRRTLIACDFDGTLRPIASSPSEVRVAPYMLEVLRHISSSPRLELAIISGRSLKDVARRLPVDAIFAGNHGLEIRGAGLDFEHECARRLRPELEQTTRELAVALNNWPHAWIEDKRLSATVHYRGVETAQHHALRCAVRRCVVGRNQAIGLRAASKALELYPKVGWGKGSAIRHIGEAIGPFDLCIAIGDDYTDETMFCDSPDHVSVRVGIDRPTKARYHLNDCSGVAIFLQHVWDVCELGAETRVATAGTLVTT